ncbi:hypothetical protein P278_29280 [Zhouia amylolytica AD3]|uniref:Uncharacterized protein n=1 Tax=Zhouia amylolytica AD3 TaxID=1286632 RepID=W2UJD3_9FLAO|nr:hypothetical protein P278_29280 [Zhouia amylolytica AD3]
MLHGFYGFLVKKLEWGNLMVFIHSHQNAPLKTFKANNSCIYE